MTGLQFILKLSISLILVFMMPLQCFSQSVDYQTYGEGDVIIDGIDLMEKDHLSQRLALKVASRRTGNTCSICRSLKFEDKRFLFPEDYGTDIQRKWSYQSFIYLAKWKEIDNDPRTYYSKKIKDFGNFIDETFLIIN